MKVVHEDGPWTRSRWWFMDWGQCYVYTPPITSMRLRHNRAPYITFEQKSLIRQRDYLKAIASKTDSRYFYQAFLHIRNQAKRLLCKLRKNYYSKKIEECKGDMKATWKVLKHEIKQPCKFSNILKNFSTWEMS